MQRTDLFEKTVMLGKIGGRRRRGQQRMKWLDGNSRMPPQLEKNDVVPTAWQDEALARWA